MSKRKASSGRPKAVGKGGRAVMVPYGAKPSYQKKGGNGENKFFDTLLSFTFDATGEVPATGQLTLIPQNVTESGRVGRKVTIRSLQIRGNIVLAPGAAATSEATTWLYLVLDMQANGAAATVAGAAGVLTSSTLSQGLINLSESGRFKILKRWVHDFNPSAGATTALNGISRHIDFYKQCNIPIEFNSTAGAITEIRSNNLFLIAGATGSGTFDDLITLTGISRLRFSDN